MSGLRRALVGLAVAGLAAGLGVLALALTSDHGLERTFTIAISIGWSFIGAGLYAWWRRPEHRMGPLMTLVGFTWFLGGLSFANSALVFNVGILVSSLWVGALGQMLVTYPSGRVESRLERGLVPVGWAAALVAPLTALCGPIDPGCDDCPENLVLITPSPTAADAVDALSSVLIVLLLVGIAVLFWRRWRAAGPAQRRVLAPVLWAGAGVAGFGLLDMAALGIGLDRLSDALDWPLLIA